MNSKQSDNIKPIIIIGGGWSGLACAISLTEAGYPVHLLESARQLGGRARSVHFKNFPSATHSEQNLDNGQHIMLGAYHASLQLFKTLGINETDIIQRQKLRLHLSAPDKSTLVLKTPLLPAPFHLIIALLRLQGLSLTERGRAISMSVKLALSHYQLKQDISVSELLTQHKQSTQIIKALWEPLCLATMNTPINSASAQVFLNVLKDSFNYCRADSDLLFFKKNLSECFVKPAEQFIINKGNYIDTVAKVTHLTLKPTSTAMPENYSFEVNTANHSFQTDTLVLATPPHISKHLVQSLESSLTTDSADTSTYTAVQTDLKNNGCLIPDSASLNYQYEAICTVYLQYPSSTKLPETMTGLFNTLSQWVIDRSLCQQDDLLAVIISGPGKHLKMSHQKLAEQVHHELNNCLIKLPDYCAYQVIIEKKATFSCQVNIQNKRPLNKTRIPGLFLAGDYTQTGYPATLEGAIKSGLSAAQLIIDPIKG